MAAVEAEPPKLTAQMVRDALQAIWDAGPYLGEKCALCGHQATNPFLWRNHWFHVQCAIDWEKSAVGGDD